MFGHNSGSGGLGLLWILASVAIGASLSATQCSSAQAQPIDLSLRQEVPTTQKQERAQVEEDDSSASLEYGVDETAGRVHPLWVEDLESKTWPGFLTGMPGYEDFGCRSPSKTRLSPWITRYRQ